MSDEFKEKFIFMIPLIIIVLFFTGRKIISVINPINLLIDDYVITMGKTNTGTIDNILGEPIRKDKDMEGRDWVIYNRDGSYKDYIQFQVQGDKVIGAQTNSDSWVFHHGLQIGKVYSKEEIDKLISKYKRAGINLDVQLSSKEKELTFINATKKKMKIFGSKKMIDAEVVEGKENQMVDYVNTMEVKAGRPPMERKEVLDQLALANNQYMIENDGKGRSASQKSQVYRKKTSGMDMGKGMVQEFNIIEPPGIIVNQLYNSLNQYKILDARNYRYIGVSVIGDEKAKFMVSTFQFAEAED